MDMDMKEQQRSKDIMNFKIINQKTKGKIKKFPSQLMNFKKKIKYKMEIFKIHLKIAQILSTSVIFMVQLAVHKMHK